MKSALSPFQIAARRRWRQERRAIVWTCQGRLSLLLDHARVYRAASDIEAAGVPITLRAVAERAGIEYSKVLNIVKYLRYHYHVWRFSAPRTGRVKPNTDIRPCLDCGTNQGKRSRTGRILRLDGARFGLDGKLCARCYHKHLTRYYRGTVLDESRHEEFQRELAQIRAEREARGTR